MILLFAVVRNNVASPASFRRLSLALVINGSLMSVFALVQFFTSAHNTVYWTYQTQGAVFGPFICRTHFPFYVNVCIGAGIGLLVGRTIRRNSRDATRRKVLAGFMNCSRTRLACG